MSAHGKVESALDKRTVSIANAYSVASILEVQAIDFVDIGVGATEKSLGVGTRLALVGCVANHARIVHATFALPVRVCPVCGSDRR